MTTLLEQQIANGLFSQNKEKTFIDKILAKDDADQLRQLIRKDRLTREDLLEILYLMTSTEAKLLNLKEWDRYVILKFFVWIREFCKIAEQLYDYQKTLTDSGLDDQTVLSQFDNNLKITEHMIKFLIDLYLNINHTTLSLNGALIFEIIRNKYELKYDYAGLHPEAKKGILGGLVQ